MTDKNFDSMSDSELNAAAAKFAGKVVCTNTKHKKLSYMDDDPFGTGIPVCFECGLLKPKNYCQSYEAAMGLVKKTEQIDFARYSFDGEWEVNIFVYNGKEDPDTFLAEDKSLPRAITIAFCKAKESLTDNRKENKNGNHKRNE